MGKIWEIAHLSIYGIINIYGGSMKNVYLLNNMSTDNEIKKELKYINSVDTISVIAGDFNNYEHNTKALEKLINWLEQVEIKYNYIYMIDNRHNLGNKQRLLDASDMIIVMDGLPTKQIKHINEAKINANLLNKGIYIGLGYGATNLGDNINLAKNEQRNILEHTSYRGIGIIDFNIEPHFDEMDLFHNANELMPNNIFNETLFLSKDSGIVTGDNITYINNVYKANFGQLEKLNQSKRK